MKKIYLLLILISTTLFSNIIVGENIQQFNINNQFNHSYKIEKITEKIVFVFKKDTTQLVTEFLDKKKDDYLSSKNILFVADLSQMPSLIRWFILEDLDKHKYSILLIKDEIISEKYFEKNRVDSIMVVSLKNLKVIGIDYLKETEELETLLENN